MPGPLKRYDVSGKEVDGRIAPAGTVLKLTDADAERMGLKKPAAKKDDGDAEAKPRQAAGTRKRPTPAKRAR